MAAGGTESTQVLDLRDLIGAPLRAVVEADMVAAEAYHRFLVEVGFHPAEDGVEATAPSPAWTRAVEALGLGVETRRLGRLRTVAFSYSLTDPATGRARTMVVRVPLLSLLPMPILQVDTAKLDFQVHLIGAVETIIAGPSPAAPGSLTGAAAAFGRASTAQLGAPGGLLGLIDGPAGGGAAAPAAGGNTALYGAAPAGGAGRPLRLFAELAARSDGGSGGGSRGRRGRRKRATGSSANLKVRVRMRQAGLPAGLGAVLNLMTSSIDGTGLDPTADAESPATGQPPVTPEPARGAVNPQPAQGAVNPQPARGAVGPQTAVDSSTSPRDPGEPSS